MNLILVSSIVFSVLRGDFDDDDLDPLAEIYDEFFEDTECFMSEKLALFGDNSQKGIHATSTVNKESSENSQIMQTQAK